MSEIQFLVGRRPMKSYSSWGTRHHCPMEVGAYVNIYSARKSQLSWFNLPHFTKVNVARLLRHELVGDP